MKTIARANQMSMGRLVKEAVNRFYSDGKDADLNKRILELEKKIEDLETDIAERNAAIVGIKRAFSQMEDELDYLDSVGVVY